MRSRAARFVCGAVAWLVLVAAGVFFVRAERQQATRRTADHAFHTSARDLLAALADVRAGQQAYVVAGQGPALWGPKVTERLQAAREGVDRLRATAASADAGAQLIEASAAVTEASNVDRRAREYIGAGQSLMAADVVFAEAADATATAALLVERAVGSEQIAADAAAAGDRRMNALVLAGGGVFAGLVVLVLVPVRRTPDGTPSAPLQELANETPAPGADLSLGRFGTPPPSHRVEPLAERLADTSLLSLRAAAQMCTELARVSDVRDLRSLLTRAADLMDASGLIVWMSGEDGELRPVLAHGYAGPAVARMPPVPRAGDNAVAAAYRTGALQIVLARPGTSPGAIVAPLLSPAGCIGALTAEIKNGSEISDGVQALAAIFAAQLAGVVGVSTGSAAVTAGKSASA